MDTNFGSTYPVLRWEPSDWRQRNDNFRLIPRRAQEHDPATSAIQRSRISTTCLENFSIPTQDSIPSLHPGGTPQALGTRIASQSLRTRYVSKFNAHG
ncbi:uncharacterized protein RSE6_08527 [Rhynchosporium secalis]|uniref:Uncharacterized protein n=1 Tax=Rhynchosporium secalis TaxID=38038 RepID=A0A1E1MFL5_RHYSE|nr:uncharacterized protein RSE6_08527 [Rhynchosporium secalis]